MAIALLDYLFQSPLISTQDVQSRLAVSPQTARTLIEQFVKLNLLKEVTGRRRSRRFSYWQYLEYFSEGTKPL